MMMMKADIVAGKLYFKKLLAVSALQIFAALLTILVLAGGPLGLVATVVLSLSETVPLSVAALSSDEAF